MPDGPLVILVVEDDPDVVFLLSHRLNATMPQVKICHVPEGEEAMRWLAQSPAPAAMITDLRMPGMPGMELIEWIRHQKQFSFPIFICSASVDPVDREHCERLGVDDFFAKDGLFRPLCDRVAARVGPPNPLPDPAKAGTS
jgi:CheY-like chemotaxis protein